MIYLELSWTWPTWDQKTSNKVDLFRKIDYRKWLKNTAEKPQPMRNNVCKIMNPPPKKKNLVEFPNQWIK